MKTKKKKGCLHRIFGWIAKAFGFLILLTLLAALVGDKEPKSGTSPGATPTPQSTSTPAPTGTPVLTETPEPTPAPLVMPGIGGSNAYDVVLSLADLGVSKPKTTHIDGGYQWSSDIVTFGATSVVYDIVANRDHEICHATFNLSGDDNGFLTYCATMPYDTADKDAATTFVTGHMTGESASITIGDALFTMTARNGGATLIIEDVDAAAYYDAKITESLGL